MTSLLSSSSLIPHPSSLLNGLIERERQVLRDLVRLAAERAAAERAVEEGFHERNRTAQARYDEVRQRISADYETARADTEAEYRRVRESIKTRFDSERLAAENELTDVRGRLRSQFTADKEALETGYEEARWTTTTLYEANKTKADAQRQDAERKADAQLQAITRIRDEARTSLAHWIRTPPDREPPPAAAPDPDDDPLPRLREHLLAADAQLGASTGLVLLKLLRWPWFGALALLLVAAGAAPAAFRQPQQVWLAGGVAAAVVLAIALRIGLTVVARRQVNHLYHPLARLLDEAEQLCRFHQAQIRANHERQLARNQERFETGMKAVEDKYQRKLADLTQRRETGIRQAEDKYKRKTAEATKLHDTDARFAEEKYPRALAEMQKRYEYDAYHIYQRCQRQLQESKEQHEADWAALTRAWQEGLARAQAEVAAIDAETRALCPDWSGPAWDAWQPPAALPPALRFGEFFIGLDRIPQGVPDAETLRALAPPGYTLPALLDFPARCSLLFKSGEAGRAVAERTLQAVMFRLLTSVPPGKVRFTVIDPVGLGQSFAAFMHLADHDEMLVSSRIWTEQAHIEQRLADLTAHMETVIQKYLRNQYKTIEEYNAHAGEVAEPFRFLVVANFPANFSAEAARRLASIAASGARCGVHTLVTVDVRQPLPQGFELEDLEKHAVNLLWKEGKFRWLDRDFGQFPFQLDTPPDDGLMTRTLQVVGAEAKEASRVEVPFEFIAPSPDDWWKQDSRSGVRVPLGRSGATKRQIMHLGQGTAQHVLIAGKTGSGKSTLLHALITNLALMYSPDEVELYLIDFKEGVEFKAYAAHELPHARVVAIESEREFGLSVLQRLDAELRVRGDRFRSLGVQDISGYRNANGAAALPRILLIVDEFQLFFIEDDKIAQEAGLLLDRLVRQGRAFGIHVLLGSQTLGGAYSLARSTIGQMAVRIALQCSEADAHLILSDDNPAARLLSRPGEAIYNDANGLVEGNDFFQVVWLSDERKDEYLDRIGELARRCHYAPPRPQIVFEGKAPADVTKNHFLQQLLTAPDWPPAPRATPAWLGEALAIKDPTAAVFRPQSGSNLLLVGQSEEAALGVLATALVSLATQHAPGRARFYVLDGSPVDSPYAGYLERLAGALPHGVHVVAWRDLPAAIAEVAAELDRRQADPAAEAAPVFLVAYGLQRFRELRKSDDDFSFSRRGEDKPSPSKQFTAIVRDGPGVGIYTTVWCDTLNNLQRSIDRQGLREFDQRVLFQMSAADSSTLIDSPLASKLGVHRALFYSEDRGQPEKFRPYGLAGEDWLGWVRTQLDRRPGEGGASAL